MDHHPAKHGNLQVFLLIGETAFGPATARPQSDVVMRPYPERTAAHSHLYLSDSPASVAVA